MRLQRTVEWIGIGLGLGMICALLLRAASFLWPFSRLPLWTAGVLAGLPLVCGAISWLWPIPWMDAARMVDASGLQARAQTALMLNDSNTPMAELQRRDALKCLRDVELGKMFPLRVPRFALIGMAVCVALYGLSFFLPNPQQSVLEQRAAFQQEMEKQAKLVDEGAVKMDAKDSQTPELRRVLGDLSLSLRKAQDPRTALTAIDEAERRIESIKTASGQQALNALKQNDMSELAQALKESDRQKAEKLMAQAEQQSLAKALEAASGEAADASVSQALAQAANAVQGGQLAQALSQLQAAAAGNCAAAVQASGLSGMVRAAVAGKVSQMSVMTGSGSQNGNGKGGVGLGLAMSQGVGTGGGAGQGSSNKDGGYRESSGRFQSNPTQTGRLKTGAYETIYDPTRLNRSGDAVAAPGKTGEGEITEITAGVGLGSVDEGVPYGQVLAEYGEQAVQAAQSAELPAYAKQWVREYFDALEQE